MSDTDDTEALLLISPNLFLIENDDSEESFLVSDQFLRRSEKVFVENLSERVGELQLCLENLESVSCSELTSASELWTGPLYNTNCFYTPQKSEKFHYHSQLAKGHTFPKSNKRSKFICEDPIEYSRDIKYSGKHKRNVLKPSNIESRLRDVSITNVKCTEDIFYNNSLNYQDCFELLSMESDSSSVLYSPEKKRDNTMLHEIDNFLDNLTKKENSYNYISQCPDVTVTTDNTLNGNLSEDCTSYLKNKETPSASAASYLSQFIYLQETERENELKKRNMPSSYIERSEATGTGGLMMSVPDLGYGMREVMYSKGLNNAVIKQWDACGSNNALLQSNIQEDDNIEISKNISTNNRTLMNQSKSLSSLSSGSHLNQPNSLKNMANSNESQLAERLYALGENNISEDEADSSEKRDDRNGKMECGSLRECESNYSDKKTLTPPKEIYTNNQTNKNYSQSNMLSRSDSSINAKNRQLNKDDYKQLKNVKTYTQESGLIQKNNGNHHMPSLTSLWVSGVDGDLPDSSKNLQQFEEEKLRREHCEVVIQQLQKKLLEQQQKLAVAMQVDMTKDEAIAKLREACARLSAMLTSAEDSHAIKLNQANSHLKNVLLENKQLQEKTSSHEGELSKALHQIQGCQEKYKLLLEEKENNTMTLQKSIDKYKELLSDKEERYNELKESNSIAVQLNKQISESVTNMQKSCEKTKKEYTQTNDQLVKLREAHERLDDEMLLLKRERSDLRGIIAEEKSRNTHLDGQKKRLNALLETANKKIETAEADFNAFKHQAEAQKEELKTFYQKQVENIVVSKLSEFQQQLDSAERLMVEELQNKEKQLAVQFAKQLQRVEQQHKLEIGIIEEKQKEEIKLYRIQLARSSQQIQQLEDNLASYKNRRGQIAAQLHSVMENQWQQALKIITNGSASTTVQMETPRELVSSNAHQPLNLRGVQSERINFSSMKAFREVNADAYEKNILDKNDEFRFNDKLTKQQTNVMISNDSSKHSLNFPQQLAEDKLQHYIKLLLQRQPGSGESAEPSFESKLKESKAKKASEAAANHDAIFKDMEDYELPTSDRNSESIEKKGEKNAQLKPPPWK